MPTKFRVYIGTYNSDKSQGIYQSEFDAKTGMLKDAELAGKAVNASFLAVHPTKKFLYAVSEISDADGKPTGGVSAFTVDGDTGKLTLLNQQLSEGGGPCHLVVDAAGKHVLVANYGGGSVAVLPIGADGKLAPASSVQQHEGSSVDPQRQQEPHAHSINLDPQNRYAFAADLGLDKVMIYQFDGKAGKLTPNDPPFAKVAPGSGPRHFAFHTSGKFAYVINEMGNTATAFRYDADRGKLTEIQTISTLPKDYSETSYTAEVVVHPSGKFLYGSNRGHNSLAAYAIDSNTGKLTLLDVTLVGGKVPRNFNIDPTGSYALVGNQDDDTISVMRISDDGRLKLIRNDVPAPRPVCIKFVAP
jgi:6-phosphogluconolactonase